MERQKYNLEICKVLMGYFENNPFMRFHQGLFVLEITESKLKTEGKDQYIVITDKFNEESEETYKKLNP